jgi:hypothetical protein
LYQVLAFAAALRCTECLVLNFTNGNESEHLHLDVGDHCVQQISWRTGMIDPEHAAQVFVDEVRDWLSDSGMPVDVLPALMSLKLSPLRAYCSLTTTFCVAAIDGISEDLALLARYPKGL